MSLFLRSEARADSALSLSLSVSLSVISKRMAKYFPGDGTSMARYYCSVFRDRNCGAICIPLANIVEICYIGYVQLGVGDSMDRNIPS